MRLGLCSYMESAPPFNPNAGSNFVPKLKKKAQGRGLREAQNMEEHEETGPGGLTETSMQTKRICAKCFLALELHTQYTWTNRQVRLHPKRTTCEKRKLGFTRLRH